MKLIIFFFFFLVPECQISQKPIEKAVGKKRTRPSKKQALSSPPTKNTEGVEQLIVQIPTDRPLSIEEEKTLKRQRRFVNRL